jgi:protein TonB
LLQSIRAFADLDVAGLRGRPRERLTGAVLAIIVELLLVLAVLSIGAGINPLKQARNALLSINVQQEHKKPPEFLKAAPGHEHEALASLQPPPAEVKPNPAVPTLPQPVPTAAAIIPVTPSQMAAADIRPAAKPGAAFAVPGKGQFGPPAPGNSGDTKSVGTAPNGQPLYAAAWYREPSQDELAGYLSTADGPGWALIACRTVPDFRVEDCVGLDEYPNGSHLERAVLAAAWQFRVRPPRLGGVSKYGEWVRIRIDYGIRRN